jgi:serine/threonine protein kinase
VITLTLLHPVKSSPVQSWTFDCDTVVRIGRSTDNQVVLYSAVVSRHHVELRYTAAERNSPGGWEIVSLGANGTYMDGQRIIRSPLSNGVIFRLARSGPNIQVQVKAPNITAPSQLERLLQRSGTPLDSSLEASDTLNVANQIQTPRSEAIAIASERYTQILEEQETPPAPSELLFDTVTGQPLNVLKTLGQYPLLKQLGQGAMASTFLGWRNGQTFVLKQLNAEWSQNTEAIARFQQQAKHLKSIRHPGVPQIVDGFMDGKQPVLVMEMVYGQTLADEVATRGPLADTEAIALALEICDVLSELHSQPLPLIHGDLHPKHLIRRQVLRSGQEIALIDFGSVRHHGWNLGLVSSSAGYTAPELQDAIVTPAIDFYALGTTLAYLLTGEDPSPFYGHHEDGYRFQPEYMTGISPKLVTLIQQLTQPQPSDRPASVDQIIQALRKII